MADIELLAPAGGMSRLKAAIQSGADAVYLGGPCFGARHSADNFSEDELKEAVEYAHLYGVDVHVTVNTLIKEKELQRLEEYIKFLAVAGVDAILVQDMGVARIVKKVCPQMPLHASTQMTVTSLEGVKYLEDNGFSRVVLARELSYDEIKHICEGAKAQIEVFVHGAICMSYSGQCLMSSIIGGRSGNRGRCAQPCRLPYTLCSDGKKDLSAHILSPKDMALINEIDKLKKIGVKSLKIEGRLKRAEYVSAVTGIYRKYIDNTKPVEKSDIKELQDAFSRGFTDGYFKNKLGKDMMSHNNPSNADKNFFSKEALARANGETFIRKIPVYINASMSVGESLCVTMYDDDNNYVSAFSKEIAGEAIKDNSHRIREQLSKLGQTPFEAMSVELYADGASMSIGAINQTRREAAQLLIKERAKREEKQIFDYEYITKAREKCKTDISVQIRTKVQLRAAVECGVNRIILSGNLVKEAHKIGYKGKLIQKTADIFKKEELLCDDIEVSNTGALYEYPNARKHGSVRLNIYNSQAIEHYSCLNGFVISPELNIGEIKDVLQNTDACVEVVAYGNIPLMIMKNCPIKAMGQCANKQSGYYLKDRRNQRFPLMCLDDCRCELLNSKPMFAADKIEDIKNTGASFVRLMFTNEGYDECKKIINIYQSALNGEKITNPFGENEFTRGHLYRGVE